MTSSAFAQMQDVQITATKKKRDEQKEREGNITITTKEIIYNIAVQNKTFKPIAELQVKYMVFLSDSQGGNTGGPVDAAHTGSETLKNLNGQGTVNFETKPIKLMTEDLDAGWVYGSGAGNRAKDKVNGVWIRAYVDGKMVGEYANPSTVKKNTWKE